MLNEEGPGPGPGSGVDRREDASENPGGSVMVPPISKKSESGSEEFRRCCRHRLHQKNTATAIKKDPATPDATETPITVPALTP